MQLVGVILTVLGGLTAVMSAVGKLTAQEQVMEILDHVGVSDGLRRALPFIQLAGGIGALVGLVAVPALGVAALAGLALYFLGAVVSHVRVGDGVGGYAIPLGVSVFMAVAAIVRGLTI